MNVNTDFEDGDDLEPLDFCEDVIDNDKFLSGPESDENETGNRKNMLHSIRRSNENMSNFYLGQVFGRKEEAKKLIRKHAVETKRLIKIKQDDHIRVRTICTGSKPDFEVDDCGVHVASQQKSKYKKGKGADKEKGKTKGASGNKKTKGKWLVATRPELNDGGRGKWTNSHVYQCPWVLFLSKMLEQIEENPNIPVKAVQDQFRRKYGVAVRKMTAYRAKMKAKKKVEGDYKNSSTVKIEVEAPSAHEATTRQFKRIYVCLAALKQGFKALNRDLLGLDGAFMKGTFPGQMLTAVGFDSSNGIYPVYYAIVESESFSSWTWFLELMAEDLEIGSNSRFTFMIDRQKELLQAIQTLFPCAKHRYCLRHIHENMKLAGHRGVLYKNMLYKCATSTTKPEFLTAMNELKEFNNKAHLWLSKLAPQSWSMSHNSGLAISNVMINNMCEVYNGKIVEGRDRPIISALEYVREYLMRRIVTWNGGDLYEVSGKPTDPRVVNLAMGTCSCKDWKITGMPCRHVVAAFWFVAANGGRVGALESWVHPVHTMDMWKLVYSFKVNPINGMTLWTKCEAPTTIVAPQASHHGMQT
ncbi:uncharacterized protein LOC143614532 [Bidens hawaiensis]|uniref:uncharacterized protein LOC143614532 n=1 Tax=Bidens hawaiensis TaxID=980011 RepID=UPI004049882F